MQQTKLSYVYIDRNQKWEATKMTEILQRWINYIKLYLAILWP